jgi:hypothetical protein
MKGPHPRKKPSLEKLLEKAKLSGNEYVLIEEIGKG